jgi:hypothetical protein
MEGTMGIFSQTWGFILMINSVLILIFVVISLRNSFKIRKFTKKYSQFMKSGFNGNNLEQLIDACIFKSQDAIDKNMQIQNLVNKLEANMLKSIQKVGLLRYSAFTDVGGDQSFSVALLDTLDNGIVLTGIYARENSSVYIKNIEGGKSIYTLTTEEIQAIDKAKRTFGERTYFDDTPTSRKNHKIEKSII